MRSQAPQFGKVVVGTDGAVML